MTGKAFLVGSSEPDSGGSRDEEVSQSLVEIVATAVGATVGFATGSLPGAVLGAALGPAAVLALRLDRDARDRRLLRAAKALDACRAGTELSLQDIEDRAVADEASSELIARVIEAAADARLEDKIEGLGRLLSAALLDQATMDEAFLIAAALREMEAPHFRLLGKLNSAWGVDWQPAGSHKTSDIASYVGAAGGATVLPAVVATLVRHGLIDQVEGSIALTRRLQRVATGSDFDSPPVRDHWVTTALGLHCLVLVLPNPPEWARRDLKI